MCPSCMKTCCKRGRLKSVLIPANSLAKYRWWVIFVQNKTFFNVSYTYPDSSDQLRRCHIYAVMMWLLQIGVLCGYSDTTVTGDIAHAVAAEYPHSTLKSTLTCSSHSGIAMYETYVASEEESGCSYGLTKVGDLLFLNISCCGHNLLGKFHISLLTNVHQCSPTCSNDCTSPASCEQRSNVNDQKSTAQKYIIISSSTDYKPANKPAIL